MAYFNTWEFIAGLAIFLFGMIQMEEAIKSLVGRNFKVFLKKQSKNKLKGILSGAGVTAILQSSSVVSLIVLAFVGAGVIPMKNAIAMVFGANLGTTITGWLVALVGFKIDIESLAYPLIGLGGLMVAMIAGQKQWSNLGRALLGLGLLFLGLGFMKTSVGQLAESFDLSPYVDYPPIVFLLIGVVLTAIIQSSSASMVITLSALYNGIIPLESAAAMVIGSDLGTTVTVLIGGMTGLPSKKRVAMAHFIFNLVTDVLAFIGLHWLLGMIELMNVHDPLLALVLLHSSFNAMGLVLFYPFIDYLANWLERRFKEGVLHEAKYIRKLTPEVPEAGIQALDREVEYLFEKVQLLLRTNFDGQETRSFEIRKSENAVPVFKQQYRSIKQLEGEMFQFYTKLQQQSLESSENDRLGQLIGAVRHLLHSAKSCKDVHKDIMGMKNSSQKILNELFDEFRIGNMSFLNEAQDLVKDRDDTTIYEDLIELLDKNQKIYEVQLESIYHRLSRRKLAQIQISTILNVNRELYSSRNALILALRDYKLSIQQSIDFKSLPMATTG